MRPTAGLYLGYLRGRSSPSPQKHPARRDEGSAHTVTFLKIVSQNAPDCISAKYTFQKTSGGHVPGPPQEARGLWPLGASSANDKS